MSDLANIFSPFGIPKAVAAADAERDKAYDTLADAELRYADVSDGDWQERAHQRDAQAAQSAVLAGKDLPTGPTHYERAAALRGEAVGVLAALRTKALQADSAVFLAWQKSAPGMADDIRAAYAAAEKAHAAAERALRNARSAMRSAASALVGTKYVASTGSNRLLPRLDGDPTWDMTLSEFCRRFVASHDMSIDTDVPEYVAEMVDGLHRFIPADTGDATVRMRLTQQAMVKGLRRDVGYEFRIPAEDVASWVRAETAEPVA
jgi:hypothetical protein